MRTLFNKLQSSVWLRTLICLSFGIWLIADPATILTWMLYILAGYYALTGLLSLVNYFTTRKDPEPHNFDFINGLLLILLSAILLSYSVQIAGIIHIFMGMMIVSSGAHYFIQSRAVSRTEADAGLLLLFYSLFIMAIGVLIVFNPFAAQVALFRVFGAILILLGIGEIVWALRFKKRLH